MMQESQTQYNEEQQYVQYPYRYVILVIYGVVNIVHGSIWVVITPISLPIAQAYHLPPQVVSLIPISFMFFYVFVNFPANWFLQAKSIKFAFVLACALAALGSAIRCLVNINFAYVIVGQIFTAISQPLILNSVTMLAVRWFLPNSRPVAISIMISTQIVGIGVGFLIPVFFVNSNVSSIIRAQFQSLLVFEFILSLVPLLMTVFWFEQYPPTPTSSTSQSIFPQNYCSQTVALFKQPKFIVISLAFGGILGAFCLYASVGDTIIGYYGYNSTEVGVCLFTLQIVGIIGSSILCGYLQNTLNYKCTYKILSILSIFVSIVFPLALVYMRPNFIVMLFIFGTFGMIFISYISIGLGYASDVFYPASDAQITGSLTAFGNSIAVILFILCDFLFRLGNAGNNLQQNKTAALNTVIMTSVLITIGSLTFLFDDSQLTRTLTEQNQAKIAVD